MTSSRSALDSKNREGYATVSDAGTATTTGPTPAARTARDIASTTSLVASLTGPDSDATRLVVDAMSRAVRAAGVGPVVVAVPASDTVAYPSRFFESSADLLLVMLYDQHWATSAPGPIASPEWARRT